MMPTSGKPYSEELPVLYQREDTEMAFYLIEVGESLALVDVGGSGKSTFVRHLLRPEVKQHYIRQRQSHQVLLILLNPHNLIHLEENALQHSGRVWPGYELMLNRLRMGLPDPSLISQEQGLLAEIYGKIDKIYRRMFDGSPLMAQSSIRRLEDAIELVMGLGNQWQIVFIFDELEEFLRVLPIEFFQSLRGLRDDHKRRLTYITTSRHSPAQLLYERTDKHERLVLEGFIELFHDFTHYLRPLDDLSVEYSLGRYTYRYRVELSNHQRDYLRYATGSHIGLMRRGYLPTCNTNVMTMTPEQFAEFLLNSEKIRKDCSSIYESLSQVEKDSMVHLAFGSRDIPHDTRVQLFNKHLIKQDDKIRIPVLAAYIRQKYSEEHS